MRGLEITKWLLRFLLILGILGKWHPQSWESLDSPRVLHCYPNTNVSLPFVLLWSLLCSTPIQGRKLKECGDRERKGGRVARGTTKCRWWRVWARQKLHTYTFRERTWGKREEESKNDHLPSFAQQIKQQLKRMKPSLQAWHLVECVTWVILSHLVLTHLIF